MMNEQDYIARKKSNGCQNPEECGCSADPFDNLTFGWGRLDDNGYWDHMCYPCARAFENTFPQEKGKCLPLAYLSDNEAGFKVGDRVAHIKEQDRPGTVKVVEDNQLSVMVQWDDLPEDELDFQWVNKLVYLSDLSEDR
jgi:hypothetical protein